MNINLSAKTRNIAITEYIGDKRTVDEQTHDNNAEVEDRPKAGEIFLEAESDPLEQHLQGEDDSVHNIQVVQRALQHWLLVQVNVLKALQPHNNDLLAMSDADSHID